VRARNLIVGALALASLGCDLAQAQAYKAKPRGAEGGPLSIACQADLEKFCPQNQESGKLKCLRAHQSQVSDVCKGAMADVEARRRSRQQGAGGPPT
jgi:hypothetical protein